MSTATLFDLPPSAPAGLFPAFSQSPRLTPLAVEARLPGRRQSIWDALTRPELVESWIEFPGMANPRDITVSRAGQAYCITWRTPEGSEAMITGIYRDLRRGRMELMWNRHVGRGIRSSTVRFGLLAGVRQTRLWLTHFGLDEASEYAWHKELWETSLSRLASLLP